jgi:hypothetical protein
METITILQQIKEMTESQLIELNNLYSQSIGSDSEVFNNDEEFFEMFYPNPGDGLKVAQAVFYGDYKYCHQYVKFNGYGNLVSFDFFDIDDLCELAEVIAEYILENFNDFDYLFN